MARQNQKKFDAVRSWLCLIDLAGGERKGTDDPEDSAHRAEGEKISRTRLSLHRLLMNGGTNFISVRESQVRSTSS